MPFGTLRSRFLVAFLLPSVVLWLFAGSMSYDMARDILEEELGKSLSFLAAATASQVSGERLLTLEPQDDERQTRTYRNFQRLLSEIKAASQARRIIAFDREGRVRVDSEGLIPIGQELPDLARDRLELSRVFQGQPTASDVLFEGSDGRLYKTGYAPIYDGDRVVGAVSVEGTAAFFASLPKLYRTFAILFVVMVLTLIAAAFASQRSISRPLGRLIESAKRIAEGNLLTPVSRASLKEIGMLASQLELMRQALESRERQLKMMIAGVAHEVKNPLGGMELFLGLLRDEVGTGTAATHVQRIRGELEYLKRIVEEFLSFARDQKMSVEEVELAAVIDEAVQLLLEEAKAKAVIIRVDARAKTISGDRTQLLSAVVNLLKNAVQAAPRGSEIVINGEAGAADYRIRVSDNGPGIPSEQQEKIFEAFYTTREKGTGLGLALAMKFVQAHKGSISVQSAPGRTEFTITLPTQNA